MLIRSQDKTRLINLNNAEKVGIYGIIDDGFIEYVDPDDERSDCFMIETPTARLGEYCTKEAAIKVLDMIQDNYAKLDCVHHGVYIHGDCDSVFQMPQDSEVEV